MIQVPEFTRVAQGKLESLLSGGYRISGVAIECDNGDGTVTRGAVTAGGMVLWWHSQQPGHEPAACWVYPEFFERIAQSGCWTAYASDGSGAHSDGVERIPLYRGPKPAAPEKGRV